LPNDRAVVANGIYMFYYDLKNSGTPLHVVTTQDDIWDVAPSPDNKYLLTASRDQILRIWRIHPKHLEVLLSMFVAGREWIVWTPQGFYAASPGGERLMGWQINNGVGKLATFYPSDRFRKNLYRPDIIKLVLERGDVVAARKAANAVRGPDTRSVNVDELLPPRAVLTVDPSKRPTLKIKVEATAVSKSQPITALRLLLDGRPVPGKETLIEFAVGKETAEVEWTYELPEGEHQLAVLARSIDSSAVSAPIHVKQATASKLPTLHVLTVGINQYKDGTLDLKYAAPDAEALAASFVKHGKGHPYQDVTAKTLLNQHATTQAILRELSKLREKTQQQDLVVVFFACHGVKQKDSYVLLTHEADVENLAATALPGNKLRAALAEFKCQVLLMLDACHSAGFGEGKKLTKLGLKPATDEATRDLTDDECAVAVLCAAMAHEKAEGKNGHGLFTKAVLQALERAPGVHVNPFNQRMYVHHLQSYVFDQVTYLSEDRQHPFLSLPWVVESFPVTQFTRK
jgi:hypothetical protein